MLSRKAQIQAVTVVLLTGLTVGVASVVYVWGEPILDKRDAEIGLESMEQDVVNLHEEILRVSQGGEGAAANIEMTADDSDFNVEMIRVDEEDNYIDIVLDVTDAPYPRDQWVMLQGENERNLSISQTGDYVLEGQDDQSVLLVRAQSTVTTYRIEFRNLFSETAEDTPLQIVDLVSEGGDVSSGGADVHVSNAGTTVDRGDDGLEISSGQTLDRSRTEVEVDLR